MSQAPVVGLVRIVEVGGDILREVVRCRVRRREAVLAGRAYKQDELPPPRVHREQHLEVRAK